MNRHMRPVTPLSAATLGMVALLATVPFSAEEASAQTPIHGGHWAVYDVTLATVDTIYELHVVIRGLGADPVGAHALVEDTEHWYLDSVTPHTGTPGLTIALDLMRPASDTALIAAVDDVMANEVGLGSAPMVPNWAAGAPTTSDVFALDVVTGGVGTYTDVIDRVSVGWQPSPTSPGMPTFYAEDAFPSVFGGAAGQPHPIQEGVVASFVAVSPGDVGYPDPLTWQWCGEPPN